MSLAAASAAMLLTLPCLPLSSHAEIDPPKNDFEKYYVSEFVRPAPTMARSKSRDKANKVAAQPKRNVNQTKNLAWPIEAREKQASTGIFRTSTASTRTPSGASQ